MKAKMISKKFLGLFLCLALVIGIWTIPSIEANAATINMIAYTKSDGTFDPIMTAVSGGVYGPGTCFSIGAQSKADKPAKLVIIYPDGSVDDTFQVSSNDVNVLTDVIPEGGEIRIIEWSYDDTTFTMTIKMDVIYSVPDCNHDWEYVTFRDATEEMDGEEGYRCKKCGARKDVKGVPALDTIINNRYNQINAAKPGVTTTLEMGNNCNFSKEFMSKIAAKNNCDFIIRFTYEHVHYEMYIPAGTKVDTSIDWYGPKKMMQLYSYKVLS